MWYNQTNCFIDTFARILYIWFWNIEQYLWPGVGVVHSLCLCREWDVWGRSNTNPFRADFLSITYRDDVIKWKYYRVTGHVRGIHRSLVNSPHKGQWRGALMFSLICAWINGWINNREAGDLRRHRDHYNVTVMWRRRCNDFLVSLGLNHIWELIDCFGCGWLLFHSNYTLWLGDIIWHLDAVASSPI